MEEPVPVASVRRKELSRGPYLRGLAAARAPCQHTIRFRKGLTHASWYHNNGPQEAALETPEVSHFPPLHTAGAVGVPAQASPF